MGLAFWLKKLIAGRVIFEMVSPISGKIQVVEDLYGRRIVVGGLTQSGGQVRRIWEKGVKQISTDQYPKPRILILGLGGGTLAGLLSQRWPKARMTGVEIDPKIIEIGKKYLGLEKVPKLEIITGDAVEFVEESRLKREKHDLVFVDLYLADQVPPRCETSKFLIGLERKLAENGLVVFNRLDYKEHKEKTEKFLDKLGKIFQTIRKKKVGGNLLIFARKKK